jgi:glycosyltransferase involved in cell wall biosynthesis
MRASSALVEAGFAVSVVDIETERNSAPSEEIDRISILHIIVPSWYKARSSEFRFFLVAVKTFIRSILRLIRVHADIYHACELIALPACVIVSRLLHKPLIFEVYDLQFPVPYTGIAFWRRLGAHLYSLLLPLCAAVIVTSPLHAQEISKRYNVPVITLVLNIPKYQAFQKTYRLRQYLGLTSHTRIALFQGYISINRGLDALVRAAPFLSEDTVIVIKGMTKGNGPNRDHLEALIAEKGVTDRIKLIPFVPYDEMLDWIASADIGLIIYQQDFSLNVRTLLPYKLFEYLMAGLPVLTSETKAVIDVVKNYDVGQVLTSTEPEAIAKAINAMLADNTALQRMRQNALEATRNDLNWEKESSQLICLYEEIVVRLKGKRNVISHKD